MLDFQGGIIDAEGINDEAEYENWLDDQNADWLATYYKNGWILNIADLVVTK
jgi:hypothetical protein